MRVVSTLSDAELKAEALRIDLERKRLRILALRSELQELSMDFGGQLRAFKSELAEALHEVDQARTVQRNMR